MYLHTFLTSALDRDKWSASRLGRFITKEGALLSLERRVGGPQSRSGRIFRV